MFLVYFTESTNTHTHRGTHTHTDQEYKIFYVPESTETQDFLFFLILYIFFFLSRDTFPSFKMSKYLFKMFEQVLHPFHYLLRMLDNMQGTTSWITFIRTVTFSPSVIKVKLQHLKKKRINICSKTVQEKLVWTGQ